MNKYKFTIDFWNEYHLKNFEKIGRHIALNNITGDINILEIGCFEGRTTIVFLESLKNSKVTVIDPDPGPNFHHNLDKWLLESGRLYWDQKYSHEALKKYSNNRFDLIYIDGDHNAQAVLEDAVISWRLLKKGGVLLFDDYLMEIKDPWFYISHKEFNKNGLMFHHPKEAIDTFLTIYKGQYRIIIDNYQIGLIKETEINGKNLNFGDSNLKTYLKESLNEQNERTVGEA